MHHRFQHTFIDGHVLTLTVDTSTAPFTMAAHPYPLQERHKAEYQKWLHEYVVHELLALADAHQVEALADKGAETLG